MGLIRSTFETVTEDSAADGEASDAGWLDEEGTQYSTSAAISLLRGCEPSSSHFHSGVWYTLNEGQDARSGAYESVSYHLVTRGVRRGRWTVAQEREVYLAVTKGSRR